ncbi:MULTISPECIES: dihydrofolate reductase family protein [unclassified Streptomyces]|uniref:dihydrofolate reductase family protein n=1 Tax=unclassified Streptomyces TaxID=2593676 RepID=UPI002252ADCC|nr:MULTISPECIES: dihydrofolate reductase family protein [unclassified Streptomyces]MCX4524606.1 dihydrofolate reductase family protein [Streptomyces sp. NBC_01551]MCX4544870.1 dihydrofolate reductase family protein [Streptomyces sp. NBC_01565]
MRKIILMSSVSLDGFVEGPERQIDWHSVDDELHQHFNDELAAMGGFIHGRVTYDLMAEYWPTADADPSAGGPEAEFAGIWRDMPKYVYSRTLRQADVGWNSTVVGDVVPSEVAALKAAPGGDLTLGGADLAASFLRHDLVDAYRIYVHPVRLGRGKPLFPAVDYAPTTLRLEGTHAFGNGVVQLRYARP